MRPKKRRWLKFLFGAVAIAAGAAVAVAGSGFFYVTSQLRAAGIEVFSTDGRTFELPTETEINGPINVLLLGSDTRVGQDGDYGPIGGSLADVIILMHINEARTNAVALSFPRDLMISVPECPNPEGGAPIAAREFTQINSTLNYGGPACTLLAVQSLTGLDIPYLAMIDFNGVIAMSEVVGGVDVCLSEPINDRYSKLYLPAGEHTLVGEEALAFLRTRHGVGDGSDLARISSQQVFLSSLARKLKDEGALTNPFTLLQIGLAAIENMTLSKSLTDLGVIYAMAREVNDVDLAKIVFLQLPVYDLEGEYAGRVAPQTERAEIIFQKLQKDEELLLQEANPGVGAVVVEPDPDENASGENAPSARALGIVPETIKLAGFSLQLFTEDVTPTETEAPANEPLPDWVQGTNAATYSCSK